MGLRNKKVATIQITRRLLFCCEGWKLRATADFLRTKEGKREISEGCEGEEEGKNT